MTKPDPSWDHYRSVLAVLEEGSLSAAARQLGLTQPTVGRHVEALEQALGTTLFLRSPTGLSPTATAQALRTHAEALRAGVHALRRAIDDVEGRVAGTVRITASDVVATHVLPAILAGLRARHPGLQIELAPSNRVQDLLQRDADIAVRMTEPTQGALVARRLGAIPLGMFARPEYLEAYGRPHDLDNLAGHALIGFDQETAYVRALREQYDLPLHRGMFALRTDNDLTGLEAIRAGFGIGICQAPLAQRAPRLEAVLPDRVRLELPVWVVMHEDLRSSRRCRAAFDALVDGLQRYVAGDDPALDAVGCSGASV
jgi:DNA-binding transcriptional LysR family regulator